MRSKIPASKNRLVSNRSAIDDVKCGPTSRTTHRFTVFGRTYFAINRALLLGSICLVMLPTASADDEIVSGKSVEAASKAGASNTFLGRSLPREEVAKAWSDEGWPLLQRYCVDCHNDAFQEAELDVTRFETLDGIEADSETADKVLNMIRFGAMPPEDYELPSDDERMLLADLVDGAIYSVTCDLRPRPGRVTARRLNRAEYDNAVRDLFGIDIEPAREFPSDEVGGGFDNNADVLSLSPMLMDKYLAAAEEVAGQVLLDPSTLPDVDVDRAADQFVIEGETKTGSFYGRFLGPDAFAWTEVDLKYGGEFRVRFRGGTTPEDSEPVRFGMFDEDGVLRATFDLKYYGGGGGGDTETATVMLGKGKHRLIFVPFLPESADESDDGKQDEKDDDKKDSEKEDSEAKSRVELVVGETKFDRIDEVTDERIADGRKRFGEPLTPDRKFDRDEYPSLVRSLSLSGPKDLEDQLKPSSHDRIIRTKPKSGRGSHVREAAIECLQPLMRRAFRGPVKEDAVRPYAELVASATSNGETFERGMQIAVSAVLVSPSFLFRIETPEGSDRVDESGEVALTQHQLASRLSFFLWSSIPDETLLDLADEGKLKGDEVPRQIKRMLKDPRSETLATEFAAQWLGLRNLEGHEPDAKSFEGFEASLLPLMAAETRRFFLSVVDENKPVSELLTADYSFLNGPLAEYYGIGGVDGDEFRRVSLEGTPRRGLLSHASVLTLTSEPTRTSPVKRGKWILENIIGTPPPEPPSGVPELGETKTAAEDATLREQLELHRADPSCAACHRVMDQLGFGLENFDAVGRFRESEGKAKIDASGVLPGGRTFAGASELSRVLGESEEEAFARTVSRRLLAFALGRELTLQDRCTIDEIVTKTKANDFRLVDLMIEVVRSRPFLYYEWAEVAQE